VKDSYKIKILYTRLKKNQITESELDEFFLLLENEESRRLSELEMKKLWDRNLRVPLDDKIRNHILELKDHAGKGTESEQKNGHVITLQGRNIRKIGIVAMGFIILVSILFASGVFGDKIEYHTGFGEREKITLPDGSVVELNANTSLVWDKRWKNKNIRQVTLDGEAFFEVSHTIDHAKFIVRTHDLNVEVLGTSFNVSNRRETTEVFLEEGSVRLDLIGNKSQEVLMTPGQKITYSRDKELVLEDEELYPETTASWKNNVLYFNNKSVAEILREVSDIYGVQFEYSDQEIRERKLNFWVPYADWETTKEAFELTMKLKIQEKDGVYVVGRK